MTLDICANVEDDKDFTDSSNWNVKIIFKDIETNEENIIYSDILTGKEIKESKTITLDLNDLTLNKKYSFDVIMRNAEEDDDSVENVWYQIGENAYSLYDDFLIGNKYSYKVNAYINDAYGLTNSTDDISLKNFYKGFDSFKLSFELLYKEDNSNYTLKEYYCVFADKENLVVSNDDVCTLNSTESNVSLNNEYFKHTVNEELYNSEFKNINYIKYEIYKDEEMISKKTYVLNHIADIQLNFITYTVTDNYGHNVLEDKIANTKKLNFAFKGVNFNENETYYVLIYEYSQTMNKSYTFSKSFTGKELNDGTAVFSLNTTNTKSLTFVLEVSSECEYNGEYCGDDEYLMLSDSIENINVLEVSDIFKTYTVDNLVAKGISFNKVKLTFDEVADADGYQIYRSTKKSSGYTLLGTSQTNEYIDTKASVKTTYYYKVRAYQGKEGSRIYSKYSTYKNAKGVLDKVKIEVSSYNYNTIKVSYDKVDGASGYQIYRSTSKNGKYSLVKTTTSLSYLDKNKTTGKTYYYKVRAYRTISGTKYYGSYSTIGSVIVKVGVPTVSVNSYSYNKIKVSITKKPLGASGYELYVSPNGIDDWKRISITSKTYIYDNNLETGKTYYYKVRAYRTVSGVRKYGDFTDVFEVTPKIVTPEINAFNLDRSTIVIGSLDDIEGAQKYEVYEIVDGKKILLLTNEDGGYWHENLVLGSVHTYVMRAYLDNGLGRQYSDFSNEVTITVRPDPVYLQVSNTSFFTQTIETYLYDIEEDDEFNVKIYRSTSKNGNYEVIYDGGCVEFDDGYCYIETESTNLRMNTTYYYKAIETLNGVESEIEDFMMEYIFDLKVDYKPIMRILPFEYNKIAIGQEFCDGVDGYQVYRSTSKNGKYTKIYDGNQNVSYLTIGFKKGYYYKVRYYKYYDGKKVYSSFSEPNYLKTGVQHLGEYPVLLEGSYGDSSIKSVTFNYKRTAGDYVYYDVKVKYNYTYSTKSMTNYYTLYFLDWSTDKVSTWTFYSSVPRGTKKNWYETFSIKVPKSAVYFYFE